MSAFTKEFVINLAEKAGLEPRLWNHTDAFERFFEFAVAAEREDNVKLLMRLADSYEHADKQGSADDIYKIVDHIRARGQQ